MDDKKISFIMCYNNEYYMQECMLYLSELIIPEGYEVDIVGISGAKSMTAGYNEGMQKTDAKYKIYMHQDVFITDKNFLERMLEIFRTDRNIGMIGMVGTPYMVKDATMWHGVRFGTFYRLEEYLRRGLVHRFFGLQTGYMEVEAIDGLLMATQYDIPWREDLFQKWDFYDVSQSFEFLRAGYKVVVPGQEKVGYIHDSGFMNLQNYNDERDKFLTEYVEYMAHRDTEDWAEYLEQIRIRLKNGFHGTTQEKQRLLSLLDNLIDE